MTDNNSREDLMNRTLLAVLVIAAGVPHAQGQPVGRGGAPPPGRIRAPVIANAKAVRSCDSLAQVVLPNITIESAAVDANNPGVCRVTAISTHPPANDKVTIWLAIPTSNWNGRFLGTGGGGFSGGSAGGVNQPAALGFAAGAAHAGHESGGGAFALHAAGRRNWQGLRDLAPVGTPARTMARR